MRRTLIGWGVFVVVVLLLELTLFNLPHWQTAGLTPQQLASQETLTTDDPLIIRLDTPEDIQTLRISANRSCQLTLGILDEGFTVQPLEVERTIYVDVPSSQYFQLHSYGRISALSITFDGYADPQVASSVTVDNPAQVQISCTANVPMPLNISPLRVLVILGVAALIWAFLPARRMYRLPLFGAGPSDMGAPETTVQVADGDTVSADETWAVSSLTGDESDVRGSAAYAQDSVRGSAANGGQVGVRDSGVDCGKVGGQASVRGGVHDFVSQTSSHALTSDDRKNEQSGMRRLTKHAKVVLSVVTALLCVVSLAQLAIVPEKLGGFGAGYSSISWHDYSNQQRAAQSQQAASTASTGEASEEGAATETVETAAESTAEATADTPDSADSASTDSDSDSSSESRASSGSRVQKGSADKSSQITAQPYADPSPLAFLYPTTYESEFAKLARAFAAGQLYLLDEPYPELVAMDNPYDINQRSVHVGSDIGAYWDTAYYDGHYYVYFGVLPVLTMYLPYYLLTGQDLPNFIPIGLCLVALLIGLTVLLVQVARRWFPRTSLGTMLLCLMLVFFGAQLGWLTLLPSIYEVPVAMALALLVWAAVCFTSLDRRPRRVVIGALLTALIFACRPQIGLFGLLFIPFGIQAILAKRGAKDRTIYLTAALLPVLIVFGLIGWYNAARFGNPLDFGAAYNLTTNDMRYRPVTLDTALMSIFAYVFQLPNLEPSFPFLAPLYALTGEEARVTLQQTWDYVGNIVVESPLGGVLWLSPLVWFTLGIFVYAKGSTFAPAKATFFERLRTSVVSWRGFALLAMALVLVVVIVDGEGAGILPRYVLDFSLPLLVLGAFGLMLTQDHACGRRWPVVVGVVMLIVGVVVFFAIAFNANMIRVTWNYEMEQIHATINYLLFS